MNNVWFTADTHYWHKNVIPYCNRPFANVEEMNEALITFHNELVKPEDTVYHLGDFAMCGVEKLLSVKKKLNGKYVLILGNHDAQNRLDKKGVRLGFSEVHLQGRISDHDANKFFLMSHFPYKGNNIDDRNFEYQLEDKGSYLVHGHIHNAWKINNRMINVGVDVWDYKPIHLDQILEIVK